MNSKSVPSLDQMGFASVLYSIKQSIDDPNVLSMNSKSVPSLDQMGFASVLYSIKQSIDDRVRLRIDEQQNMSRPVRYELVWQLLYYQYREVTKLVCCFVSHWIAVDVNDCKTSGGMTFRSFFELILSNDKYLIFRRRDNKAMSRLTVILKNMTQPVQLLFLKRISLGFSLHFCLRLNCWNLSSVHKRLLRMSGRFGVIFISFVFLTAADAGAVSKDVIGDLFRGTVKLPYNVRLNGEEYWPGNNSAGGRAFAYYGYKYGVAGRFEVTTNETNYCSC